jgi:hypothetical protein
MFVTGENLQVFALADTTDLMYKQTDYSHALVQYPLPGCITHQRKRKAATEDPNRTYNDHTIIPWQPFLGTNRAFPYREPYFYSTCLIGFELDAFEGVRRKIRSGRYLGNNSIFLQINNSQFNTIDMVNVQRSVNVTIGCLHDARVLSSRWMCHDLLLVRNSVS